MLTLDSTFLTYGSFCFSMFVFVWFFIPETKGLSLERMDDLFGITELVKNMEADGERNVHGNVSELDVDGKKANIVHEEKVSH